MNFISEKIIKFRKEIVIFFIILSAVMGICMSKVKINYNMQDYLPEDANSTKAITIMSENFDDNISNANVLVSDVTIEEALDYKSKLEDIEGVENVSWLDKALDTNTLTALTKEDGTLETSMLDETTKGTLEGYYKDKNTLFQVTVESGKEKDTVNSIYDLIGENGAMNGTAVEQASAQNLAMEQSIKSIALIAPIIIIILILATKSWIEPILYLSSIGIAVGINLGLCIFQGEISYVTLAVAPLLQLAVSLDYAVFLSHSFDKYRKQNMDIKDAMKLAMKDSLKSISASCLTTLFGFVALLFMNFKIGPDMGIALVRGVALSFLSVMTFLPAIILCSYKLNDKCKHRDFLPNFKGLSNLLVKARIPALIFLSLIVISSYNLQGNNKYIYGSGEPNPESRLAIDSEKIEDTFGKSNMIAILVPKGNDEAEKAVSERLGELDYTENVISYASTVGFDIPKDMIPEDTLKNFYSDKYSRIVVSTTLESEGEKAFKAIDEVKSIVYEYYDEEDVYMCGNTVNMYDMKNTIEADNSRVGLITLIAIFVILLIEFKSIILPLILILGVKGSIWITMAMSSIAGDPLCYIGYLVVSTVMMGATIDYSILITDNYIKNRKTMLPKEAMSQTLTSSIKSILVSAVTLAFAGFALGLSSGDGIVKSLGLMLGKGTVISFLISITLLPAILVVFDKLLPKFSIGMDFLEEKKEKVYSNRDLKRI
ncbi:MAG: MMPL family transporter [Clostridia bacterium]|nr:MMPL family transporter [Clostridia bacterium]